MALKTVPLVTHRFCCWNANLGSGFVSRMVAPSTPPLGWLLSPRPAPH